MTVSKSHETREERIARVQRQQVASMTEFAQRLATITEGVGYECHEPDNAGVRGHVLGGRYVSAGTTIMRGLDVERVAEGRFIEERLAGQFDNAFGDVPFGLPYPGVEFRLVLTRDNAIDGDAAHDTPTEEVFNLATLVALARIGAAALGVEVK